MLYKLQMSPLHHDTTLFGKAKGSHDLPCVAMGTRQVFYVNICSARRIWGQKIAHKDLGYPTSARGKLLQSEGKWIDTHLYRPLPTKKSV